MVIVAAVDQADQTGLVEEAAALAEAFGEELHVVNVNTPPHSEDIGPSLEDSEVKDRIRASAAELAESTAESIAPDASFIGLLADDPATALLSYVREQDARYLVIGGRNRSPTGKVLFGSTAQDILLNAERPVLSVMNRP